MKRVFTAIVISTVVLFSGCINIIEKLQLNKDGSGHYTFTMDLSEMFDPTYREFIIGAMEEEGAGLGGEFPVMDTIMYYSGSADLSKLERPEVFEGAFLHMRVNEGENLFETTMHMDFSDVDDIDYFLANVGALGGDNLTGDLGGGLFPTSDAANLFSLKGKKLIRNKAAEIEEASSEDMEMAKMMMATNTYTVIYELPGKVKKTTIKSAKIKDNVITVSRSIGDVISGYGELEGEIRYK
jgi:hypothetical protein